MCEWDYDFDMKNEIIIGNYSGMIIGYKFDSDSKKDWKIEFTQNLDEPIQGFLLSDIYDIGVKYLLCITKRGLLVLSPKLDFLESKIKLMLYTESQSQKIQSPIKVKPKT